MSGPTVSTTRSDQDRAKQLLDLALRREISQASDSDELRDEVQQRARKLAQPAGITMAQMRNLENIAYSTPKVSDITDHLKQQIGRSNPDKRWRYQNIGQEILTDLLDKLLPKQVEQISQKLNAAYPNAVDEDLPRRVHLAMCRAYVRQLTANFLYERVQQNPEEASHERSSD